MPEPEVVWPDPGGSSIIRRSRSQPQPVGSMDKLLLHAGVFALFTFIVYLVCMWFVRLDERAAQKPRRRR